MAVSVPSSLYQVYVNEALSRIGFPQRFAVSSGIYLDGQVGVRY